ncbi:MAG: hypothetical protein HOI95_05830 [Chromatiales bacterium]|nr:hypothetical protein [Chromatiales bacterium]
MKIRTLLELPVEQVIGYQTAVRRLHSAAKLTTPDNALIPLAPEDLWPTLNCILNALSMQFAEGFVRMDLGKPVDSAP